MVYGTIDSFFSLCLQTISHWVHAKKNCRYAELLSVEIGGTKDGRTEGTNQALFTISVINFYIILIAHRNINYFFLLAN